jgi:MSHA biogenesis protein MshQ
MPATSGWSAGLYQISDTYAFTKSASPDGPYDLFLLTASVSDPDGGSLISSPAQTNTTKIRNGRLRFLNGYGSEFLDLPMSLTAQYWNGSGFVTNTSDTCTTLAVPTSASGMVFGPVPPGNLSAGETVASMYGVTSGSPALIGGDAGFKLSKPGAGNNGYVDTTVTAPSWLQYPWAGGASASPTARGTFGVYKSPLVFRRENY